MKAPQRKLPGHETPAWVTADAIYFITVCLAERGINGLCREPVGSKLIESIALRNERQIWYCHVAVVMPDHIHLLLSFPDTPRFSKVVGDWKRWTTTHLEIEWQRDFFEHRLRGEEGFDEKAEYILQNPVRAGLVVHVKDWPYQWTSTG